MHFERVQQLVSQSLDLLRAIGTFKTAVEVSVSLADRRSSLQPRLFRRVTTPKLTMTLVV